MKWLQKQAAAFHLQLIPAQGFLDEFLESESEGTPYHSRVGMNVGRHSHDAAELWGELPALSLLDFRWQLSPCSPPRRSLRFDLHGHVAPLTR